MAAGLRWGAYPPILRTIPEQVFGPGHNSVVRGPDNRQLYCVYHRWGNGNGRLLAIDPLDFAGERMLILGPSHTPQPVPLPPTFADFFDGELLKEKWRVSGYWEMKDRGGVTLGASGETPAFPSPLAGRTILTSGSPFKAWNG
ncbi:MAG: hypothetical protein IPK53_09865 [bacterium]|nr:hypothetical protein [bacterium]